MMYLQTTPRTVPGGKWDRRHVGLFYWVNYWRFWDKVLSVDGSWVTVVRCDERGQPVEEPRRHCTPPEPAMFAARPFRVTRD